MLRTVGSVSLVGEGAPPKSDFSEVFNICESKLETKVNKDMQTKFFPKHPCSSGVFSTTVFKKASGESFFIFILAKCKQTTTLISTVAYSVTAPATAFEDKVRKKFFSFTCGNVYCHRERDFNLKQQGVLMYMKPCWRRHRLFCRRRSRSPVERALHCVALLGVGMDAGVRPGIKPNYKRKKPPLATTNLFQPRTLSCRQNPCTFCFSVDLWSV